MNRMAVKLTMAAAAVLLLAAPARADLTERLGALSGDNVKGYLGPIPEAFSSMMNSGIFQSGFVPKSGGTASFKIHVMASSFTDEDRTFKAKSPYGFAIPAGTDVDMPTFVGDGKSKELVDASNSLAVFPGGFDLAGLPFAAPELTFGSLFGTRGVVRWVGIDLKDSEIGKFSYVGFGAQHSISQYFEKLPVDVAGGLFYQTLTIGDVLDIKAMHLDVTASRRFGKSIHIDPYVGVGYDTFSMKASYTSKSGPTAGEGLTIDFDDVSSMHLTAGAQLSLWVFQLHGEVYSAANPGATLGLGLGF